MNDCRKSEPDESRSNVLQLQIKSEDLLDADALFTGEQHFKTLAEASFEGIALTEEGVVVDCSDQLADMLGYSRKELIGKHAFDFVAPQSRPIVEEAHRTNREEPYEHVALRKDGTTFHVEVRARFMKVHHREFRVAAIRDITERKCNEEILFNERNLLRTLIDSVPDLIYFKDTGGRYILNNRAHLLSMGLSRQEDTLGKSSFDFHPADLARQYFADEQRIVATGEPLRGIEELAFHKDKGENRWHLTTKIPVKNSRGEVTSLVGISRDITEQKQLEEQRDRYVRELQDALDKVTTLSGLLPICAGCKKIRNDQGYWQQVEGYIMEHSSARFTHGLCPECVKKLYPDLKK